MSDCSSQAMMPKERRTCGTCAHGVQTNVFCRESDGPTVGFHSLDERGCKKWVRRGYVVNNETLQGFADRIASLVGMEDMADCPCGLVDIYHAAKSKINELEAAEQRYERLAQVAREMYELIAEWESDRDDEHEKMFGPSPLRGAVTDAAKRQLEALGVSVDDM